MILRFEVNQAEAFRQGVNVEKSTNHLNVNPADLSQEDRDLIADRLEGIDVCQLEVAYDGKIRTLQRLEMEHKRIVAKLPTFESLMEAILENEKAVHEQSRMAQHLVDGEVGKALKR